MLFSEVDDQLTEKISRIAFLEKEMQEYKQSINLDTNIATLYYLSEVSEASTTVTIDNAEIFDNEVVAVRSQALDFSRL